MRNTREDRQGYYICGQCKTKIFYLLTDGRDSAVPCPDCGWSHADKDKRNIPSEIKLDLTKYGG